jgi:hypothetical protein
MRCACEILCFLLHNIRARYPDEISFFLGPLRALRMRFCLAVVRCLEEITWFLDGGEMRVEGCDRLSLHDDASLDVLWIFACKLGGSFAGEMNVRFVVMVGASPG